MHSMRGIAHRKRIQDVIRIGVGSQKAPSSKLRTWANEIGDWSRDAPYD
jgi:hypothetical protein